MSNNSWYMWSPSVRYDISVECILMGSIMFLHSIINAVGSSIMEPNSKDHPLLPPRWLEHSWFSDTWGHRGMLWAGINPRYLCQLSTPPFVRWKRRDDCASMSETLPHVRLSVRGSVWERGDGVSGHVSGRIAGRYEVRMLSGVVTLLSKKAIVWVDADQNVCWMYVGSGDRRAHRWRRDRGIIKLINKSTAQE